MSAYAQAHPSPHHLLAFGLGCLGLAESAAVEDHLGWCAPCGRLLDGLPEDNFVTTLRSATRLPPGDHTAGPTSMGTLERAGCAAVPTPIVQDTPSFPAELDGHARYRVERLLGRGGMGTVYRAEHTLMERPVALKVIDPRLLSHTGALARFRQEVKAAARLDHPNIVKAYDAEQAGSLTFLIMEFVEGSSLADVLRARGPLPIGEACDFARQAALGLQHAHEQGMVHRDIKPHNLMLTPQGQVKVLDFGLARFVREQLPESTPATPLIEETAMHTTRNLTETGAIMGTVDYVAPEQARDARQADSRADVYSLGCTLYQLLTGRVPFAEGDTAGKLARLATDEPPALETLRPDVPAGLGAVVRKMMAKRPEDRYRTPAQVAAALVDFAGFPGPSRRRLWRVAVLVLVALMFGLLATWAAAGVIRLAAGPDREIVIKTDAPDIEVLVDGDRIVRIVDPQTGKAYKLDRENMTLRADDPDGLSVVLDGERPIVIRRQGKQIATVRVETNKEKSEPPVPRNVGEVRTFQARGLRALRAPAVAVSPDGQLVAAGAQGEVRLYDRASGKELRRLKGPTPAGPYGVTFSPDSKRLAATSHDFQAYIWDVDRGELLHTLKGHTAEVIGLSFSPDGTRLLTASWDLSIRLWDAATGKELRRLAADPKIACAWGQVAFLPGGKQAVIAGWSALLVLDVDTDKFVRVLPWNTAGRVGLISLSADGTRVVTLGADGTDGKMRLWDVAAGKLLRTFDDRFGPTRGAALLPDGRRIVTSSGAAVRLWDADSGALLHTFTGHADLVGAVTTTGDGQYALSSALDETVRLWRLPITPPMEKVGELRRINWAGMHLYCTAFSPDGRYHLACGEFVSDRPRSTVRVWETATGRVVAEFPGGQHAAFTPDGRQVLAPDPDGGITLWDVATAKPVRKLPVDGAINTVRISSDGKKAAVAQGDGTIRIWSLATGEVLHALDGHQAMAAAFFLPGGKQLASRANGVRLWEVETGKLLRRWDNHPPNTSWTAAFGVTGYDPRSRQLMTCTQSGVHFWDALADKPVRTLKLPEAADLAWAFSPDGTRFLYACAKDNTVRLVELDSGKELARFAADPTPEGHLAFSTDGRHATGASGNGWVYLWRLPDPSVPAPKIGDALKQGVLPAVGAPLRMPAPEKIAEGGSCGSYDDSLTGGQVFAMYCSSCHNAAKLGERDFADYKNLASHLRMRANLTGNEYARLMEFLRRCNDVPSPNPLQEPSPKLLSAPKAENP